MASPIGDLLSSRRHRLLLTLAFFLLSLFFLILHFNSDTSSLPFSRQSLTPPPPPPVLESRDGADQAAAEQVRDSSDDVAAEVGSGGRYPVRGSPDRNDAAAAEEVRGSRDRDAAGADEVRGSRDRDADVESRESRNPEAAAARESRDNGDAVSDDVAGGSEKGGFDERWRMCHVGKGVETVDYIPCLDNMRAIKELKSRRHMEHRERHCPKPAPRCLVPLPKGYRVPVPWPKSRDMIWYDNVPHQKLVEYKKDQNWVRRSDDYFVFPGGGTQFKFGVSSYIKFIEKILPAVKWGERTRVVLDVGCGVASFGGYLLDRDVITISFAPKDEHEAQIQFALERGIPAFLSVIGTQKLPFPDNVFDMIHCARCRVHWDADGGRPLMELNRILRPGGYFVWSATPVYRDDTRDQNVWNAMVTLTDSICWKIVAKSTDESGIGVVIYQKPVSNSCYEQRKVKQPPLCENYRSDISWYMQLDKCVPPIPVTNSAQQHRWPVSWPERLGSKPSRLKKSNNKNIKDNFYDDVNRWDALVSNVYMHNLAINWSSIRNVMDMNAGFGGFAAALIDQRFWVMNTVPVHEPDTLPVVFDRGLIGIYHDWCEAFNTYPRTYDMLHSCFLFGNLTKRCDIVEVVVEMDRILRPGGWVLIQDTLDMIEKVRPVLTSLHWTTAVHEQKFLVGKKDFWRPAS